MRFDLTVNEFTREVALGRELTVFGESFWRPYCHVRDLARSVVTVLGAPVATVAFEVFNVGSSEENYQKSKIIDVLRMAVPEARFSIIHKQEDPRDYRVSFAKIQRVLGFSITRTVPDGVREILDAVRGGVFPDPDSEQYGNTPGASASPHQTASRPQTSGPAEKSV